MGFITVETIVGLTCPLTVLENMFRDVDYSSSFISHWMAQILYWNLPSEVFVLLYSLCLAWVLIFMEGLPPNSENEWMDNKTQIRNEDVENPFSEMGFIKFWVVSTVFWFSFPVSLVLCYLAMGQVKTKQLVKALVHDFLQTLFLLFAVVCVILYAVYYFISNLF